MLPIIAFVKMFYKDSFVTARPWLLNIYQSCDNSPTLHKKWHFLLGIFSVNIWPNPHFFADLVTFTIEILKEKFQFLWQCSHSFPFSVFCSKYDEK